MVTRLVCIGCLAFDFAAAATVGEESGSAASWISAFSDNWDEKAWTGGRRGYIRPLDDDDWQIRMRALRGISRLGAKASQDLLNTLQSGEAPSRILAAQALGYTEADVSTERLLDLYKNESDPAVRLYLVDAMGMLGNGLDAKRALQEVRKSEDNGDVKKHIAYVFERGADGISSDVLRTLRDFDLQSMGSARLGEPAPDFRLKTANGEELQLSQFKGEQPVVLVFIYGDT